jgi:hypothetical protein
MRKNVGRFVYWTPRILSILFIFFIALFSFDVIQPGMNIGQILTGLVMHNIPAFALLILLIISWKYEIVGGIGYILAGLAYIGLTMYQVINSNLPWYLSLSWSLSLSGPAFLIGILFLMNWFKKKKA